MGNAKEQVISMFHHVNARVEEIEKIFTAYLLTYSYIVVSSSLLIHGSIFSLTKFFNFCGETSCKLIAYSSKGNRFEFVLSQIFYTLTINNFFRLTFKYKNDVSRFILKCS